MDLDALFEQAALNGRPSYGELVSTIYDFIWDGPPEDREAWWHMSQSNLESAALVLHGLDLIEPLNDSYAVFRLKTDPQVVTHLADRKSLPKPSERDVIAALVHIFQQAFGYYLVTDIGLVLNAVAGERLLLQLICVGAIVPTTRTSTGLDLSEEATTWFIEWRN